MNKTLIALAAIAAATAASAQVTVSGTLAYGYESTESKTNAAVVKANGLAVTDGHINFSANEDLGNGLKVSASTELLLRGRDTAIAGRDASITLSGAFGSFTIGSIDTGNGIIGLGSAGAPVYGMDGAVIASDGNADIAQYVTPAMSGFTAKVVVLDAPAAGGMQSTAATQDATVFGVNYAAGPLTVAADYTTYGLNAVAAAAGADNRVRVSASYDLGMLVVGFGYENAESTANVSTNETILGVAVPMGAWTLGANYATSKVEDDVKVSGFDLGAQYTISKRTNISLQYQNVDNEDADGVAGASNNNSKYRVKLQHSF